MRCTHNRQHPPLLTARKKNKKKKDNNDPGRAESGGEFFRRADDDGSGADNNADDRSDNNDDSADDDDGNNTEAEIEDRHVGGGAGAGAKTRRSKLDRRSLPWSWARLEREVFGGAGNDPRQRRANAIAWARRVGLLRAGTPRCPNHGSKMTFHPHRSGYGQFRCPARHSVSREERPVRGEEISAAQGRWFQRRALPIETAVRLMYCWARRLSYEDTRLETLRELARVYNGRGRSHLPPPPHPPHPPAAPPQVAKMLTVSSATMAAWFDYCRELIAMRYMARERDRGRIGGPGRIVQIDEAKIGRRKFCRGRGLARGEWLLGMIENGSEDFRLEICPGGRRTDRVLLPLIKRHVLPGTIVRTDKWRGYLALSKHDYVHEQVNHREGFVTPEGVHTQRIESFWRPMRRYLIGCKPGPGRFAYHCIEYQWRRYCRVNGTDTFEDLLRAIRDYHSRDTRRSYQRTRIRNSTLYGYCYERDGDGESESEASYYDDDDDDDEDDDDDDDRRVRRRKWCRYRRCSR